MVTHEADFASSPEFFERWFRFCRENKASIRTVRRIVQSYPREKIVEVKRERQGAGPVPRQGSVFLKVRTFHELLEAKRAQQLDTSAAEELDRQSREAAGRGDMRTAEQLLDRAIGLLNRW